MAKRLETALLPAAQAVAAQIKTATGYPKAGIHIGRGPWRDIAPAWTGPGTPGWLEQPNQAVLPEGAEFPTVTIDVALEAAILASGSIPQEAKTALQQAIDGGPPVRIGEGQMPP